MLKKSAIVSNFNRVKEVIKIIFSLCFVLSFSTHSVANSDGDRRDLGIPVSIRKKLLQAQVPLSASSFFVQKVVPDSTKSMLHGYISNTGSMGSSQNVYLSHRAQIPMNPASVMKLVTTFAALDILGAAFTWNTHFLIDGRLDKSSGTLFGNLIIQGGGDPKWVLERIENDFKILYAVYGIRHIVGNIILDNSIFEGPFKNTAEFDGEPLRPYNSQPDGLLVNFKSIILKFIPDLNAQVVHITSEPPMANVRITQSVPIMQGECLDWRSALQMNALDPEHITFNGDYSAQCGEKIWPIAYVDADSYAQRVIAAMYANSGAVLDGEVQKGKVPEAARLVWTANSLPLERIIFDINKFSNNVMAQQVFLTLSAKHKGVGRFDQSREIVQKWWRKTMGHNIPEPQIGNGSGLSRNDQMSAEGLASLLQKAAQHQQSEYFVESLPVVGVDGTTKRMPERGIVDKAIGRAQIKTGTLRDVVAVAGYVMGASGTRYVAVGIVNHPNAQAASPALDALLEWVANDCF